MRMGGQKVELQGKSNEQEVLANHFGRGCGFFGDRVCCCSRLYVECSIKRGGCSSGSGAAVNRP
jgi:hypothetical protein